MRSPSYPSTPLREAVVIVEKMFEDVRTAEVDREVAAQSMGYSGITGRSGKVLSNLIQYGLLRKTGKNEVSVTARAVDILHPDSEKDKARAVLDAANEPELFQELNERFPDAVPSENALRSYLLKSGFTDAALPQAIRAYVDTCHYARQFWDYESHRYGGPAVSESAEDEQFSEVPVQPITAQANGQPVMPPTTAADEPQFNVVSMSRIVLGGSVNSKEDADRVIKFMNAMRDLLPTSSTSKDAAD